MEVGFVEGDDVSVAGCGGGAEGLDAEVLDGVADGLAGGPVVVGDVVGCEPYGVECLVGGEVDGDDVGEFDAVQVAWEGHRAAGLVVQEAVQLGETAGLGGGDVEGGDDVGWVPAPAVDASAGTGERRAVRGGVTPSEAAPGRGRAQPVEGPQQERVWGSYATIPSARASMRPSTAR